HPVGTVSKGGIAPTSDSLLREIPIVTWVEFAGSRAEFTPIGPSPVGRDSEIPMACTMRNQSTAAVETSFGSGRGKRAMNPRHYVDLKDTSRELQPTYYFMVNCLLYSRMETGLVSNQDFYDEDVNVYLAHLLHSFINPDYVEQSRRFLSKYDTEV